MIARTRACASVRAHIRVRCPLVCTCHGHACVFPLTRALCMSMRFCQTGHDPARMASTLSNLVTLTNARARRARAQDAGRLVRRTQAKRAAYRVLGEALHPPGHAPI